MQLQKPISSTHKTSSNQLPNNQLSSNIWNHVQLTDIGKWENYINYQNMHINHQQQDNHITQLFTKLKISKSKQHHLINHNANFNNNHTNNLNIQNYFNQQIIKNNNTPKIYHVNLTQKQIQKFQILKLQKVQYVVQSFYKTGRSVKEILSNDVMPMLHQQILNLLDKSISSERRETNNEQIIEKFTKDKSLQTTTESSSQSSRKADKYPKQFITPINHQHKQQQITQLTKTLPIHRNQIQNIDNNQNTSLSNKNHKFFNQLYSFQRNQNSIKNYNIQIGNNVRQFTLEEKNDYNYQNFTQRQNQVYVTNSENSLKNYQRMKHKQTPQTSQFNQTTSKNTSFPIKTIKTYQLIRNKCKAKLQQLTSKSQRIPKGKAIKNRVMGNTSLQLLQVLSQNMKEQQ